MSVLSPKPAAHRPYGWSLQKRERPDVVPPRRWIHDRVDLNTSGLASRIARAAGAKGLTINYRLSPEHPFPAASNDAVETYNWLIEQKYQPQRIAVAADSAGDGLTMTLLLAGAVAGYSASRDRRLLVPLGGYGIGPVVHDGEYRCWSSLPPRRPFQVCQAGVLLDESTLVAGRVAACGVPVALEVWPDMIHVWQWFASWLPEAVQAIKRVGVFIRGRIFE